MPKLALGGLNTSGWITDPQSMLVTMFENFITSDFSQTHFYEGDVLSLPYFLAKYAQQPELLKDTLQIELMSYFRKYFDNAVVAVETTDPDDTGRIELVFSIAVEDQSKRYSLAESIAAVGSNIVSRG